MPDYQKAKIYKLWSPSKNLVYYGSTVQPLSQRLGGHIRTYKYNKEKNLSSFLVLECEDYKIELVEDYPCNNLRQLLNKEGEYQKNNVCVNKNVNYYNNNYEENKQEIIKKVKEYQKNNADKIKEREKKYYENNPDKLKEKCKKYRDANKEKIKEQRRQKYLRDKELKKELKDKL